MAMADYHICDCCGDAKTFYDANNWDGGAVDAGFESGLWGAADIAAICSECAKTHKVVIVTKEQEEQG